jgi:Fic family protein
MNGPTLNRSVARARLEESISSAELAGADVSYETAREMLRTGRPPRDKGERMVVNLQLALQKAGEWRDRALSPAMVQEIHRCLTAGTLDDGNAAGRLRRKGEDSPVVEADGTIRHEPPPAGELPGRMELMCAFANGQAPEFFIHPVIRAMGLHFWLAHDRPFLDGNGRTARVLFLWAMRRQGYHIAEFISISSIIRRAPARYAQAFLHTETDDNDLTYFLLHQAEVVRTAEREWRAELVRSAQEVETAEKKLRGFAELNARQQALVVHALHHPETRYRIAHHQHSHGVTHQTARDDLFDLSRRGLATVGKEGRIYVFCAPADLLQRLQSEAKRQRGRREAISTDELPTALL